MTDQMPIPKYKMEIMRLTGRTEEEASSIAGDCDEGFDDNLSADEYAGEILDACDSE